MAKASSYMPFDTDDRLEIFGSKRGLVGGMGSFEHPTSSGGGVSDEAWRGGGASVASGGLDVWPSAYSEIADPSGNATNASDMPWGRQQQHHEAGDEGQQHHQVRFAITRGATTTCRVWSLAGPLFLAPPMLSFLWINSFFRPVVLRSV